MRFGSSVIGPLSFSPYCRDSNGGRSGANGLREFKSAVVKIERRLAAKLVCSPLVEPGRRLRLRKKSIADFGVHFALDTRGTLWYA